ncbi:MAG: biopolymer transporter ExbD [Bdellovibrio sp.]|nr:MAG: biopolymer transporter ExbD [Bdellovibrio sp.]
MASKINNDQDDAPIAEINIVPFVDIILVVLIIFMVTTPFIMKPSIHINLPKAASGEETTPTQLNFSITANGTIFLNGKKISENEISEKSKEALSQNPLTQAIISADKDVPHGTVIKVIDLVKSSGITKFAITIDKK